MEYRLVNPEDFGPCEELIAESGYYDPVVLADLDGIVVGAYTGDLLVACVWLGITGTRTYLDFLVANPKYTGAGARVLVHAHTLLAQMGVKQVVFYVHHENATAGRIAEAFNSKLSGPYVLGYATVGARDG